MKKHQIDPAIVLEWNFAPANGEVARIGNALSKNDLRALAQALGRMAVRRDLASALEDRARSVTTPDVMPVKVQAKALN